MARQDPLLRRESPPPSFHLASGDENGCPNCLFSPSTGLWTGELATVIVVARGVQGIGGSIASSVSLSIVLVLFPQPAEWAKAMSVWGFVGSGGASIGVIAGGLLTQAFNWHWIFLVNVPIGAMALLLVRPLLERYATAAGLAHPISPHRLRHFLLTWLKKQVIDDALIQPYSGHASRQSLEIYSRLAIADAQKQPTQTSWASSPCEPASSLLCGW